VITSDDASHITYSAPHWLDENLDGDADDAPNDHKYPVCFRRSLSPSDNLYMKATVKLVAKPESLVLGGTLEIEGDGPGTMDFAKTIAASIPSPPPQYPNMIGIIDKECSQPFAQAIDIFDPMEIEWKVSLNGTPSLLVNTSSNQVYITWDNPKPGSTYHTLLHTGCKSADGVSGIVGTNDDLVLVKIWDKFKTKAIQTIGRKPNNILLTYYGFFDTNNNGVWDAGIDVDKNSPSTCGAVYYHELLSSGNGQCHSWAEMLHMVLCGQGLDKINGENNKKIRVENKSSYVAFAIKNWNITGTSPRIIIDSDAGVDGLSPYIPDPSSDEAADAPGEAGQGNSPNSPSNFMLHFIVKCNNYFYDPSYGLGPYTDLKKYENDAFDGSIILENSQYKLKDLPPNNNDPSDRTDEICDYTEKNF